MALMTSSSSIKFSPYLINTQTDFNFQGIFVHPSHLSPTGSFSSDSDSMSYMDEDVVVSTLEEDFPILLPSPSSSRSSTEDYFSSAFNPTPFTSSLYQESPSTTPTGESFSLMESTNMNRRTTFPSGFSFDNRSMSSIQSGPISPCNQTFPLPSYQFPLASTSTSTKSTTTTSSPRGGAMMMRSVSTPVETQFQLDSRNKVLSAVAEKMGATVVKQQVRAKSSAGLESMRGGAKDTRFGAGTLLPNCGFEENWGAALPSREITPVISTPFPYNLVHSIAPSSKKPMQTRPSRSLSALTIPNKYPTTSSQTSSRHNSLPSTVESSPSSALHMNSRMRRATFMTPITSISEPLFPVNEVTL